MDSKYDMYFYQDFYLILEFFKTILLFLIGFVMLFSSSFIANPDSFIIL